jgi:hypothetical protein
MSAQLTRVGMQVAGCKLLGYSGVQLMGIQDVKTLEMVLARIQEACQQYRRYTDWLTAWNEYHSFIDFAPRPGAYYAFSRLLTPEQQHFSADTCTASERPCPDALALDRFRSFCLRWLLQPYTPEWLRTSARFLACGRCPQVDCGLRACDYLCPRECPKNLPYGACGGSAPDGTCEFGHATCFHHRVLALAARRHTLDRLEEAIAD